MAPYLPALCLPVPCPPALSPASAPGERDPARPTGDRRRPAGTRRGASAVPDPICLAEPEPVGSGPARLGSGRKPLAPAGAAALNDKAPADRRHAGAEAVPPLAHDGTRLVGALHRQNSWKGRKNRGPVYTDSCPSSQRRVPMATGRNPRVRFQRRDTGIRSGIARPGSPASRTITRFRCAHSFNPHAPSRGPEWRGSPVDAIRLGVSTFLQRSEPMGLSGQEAPLSTQAGATRTGPAQAEPVPATPS